MAADVLLAVDIGNTNVKLGAFRGEALLGRWRMETNAQRTADEHAAILGFWLSQLGLTFADLGGVSFSSTVPALAPTFRELAGRYLPQASPFVQVSADANTGITIDIDNPREMGADRIVGSLAAARLYRHPAIVLGFGTATTFDAVDRRGHLIGTAIAPGFQTAMEGLFQRAAKLSRIELARPATAIGRNTAAALHSGWVFGYVGLVEGLVTRIKAELGGEALVIATGGFAEEVIAETRMVDVHDPLLTLKGLRLFYELNAAPLGSPGVSAGPAGAG